MRFLRIGVCLKAENSPLSIAELRRGIQSILESIPDVEIIFQNPNSKNPNQLHCIEHLLTLGIDALILCLGDSSETEQILARLGQTSMATVLVNEQSGPCALSESLINACSIGFDNFRGGFDSGKLFVEILRKNSKVLILHDANSQAQIRRIDGFKSAIKDHLKLLLMPISNDEAAARGEVIILAAKEKNLSGIFAATDSLALGAVAGLHEINRNDILVAGFDATLGGRIALKKRKLTSTVSTDSEALGRIAIESALAMLRGEKIEPKKDSPVELLTADMFSAEPSALAPRREYPVLESKSDLSECDYSQLSSMRLSPIVLGSNVAADLAPRLQALAAEQFFILFDSSLCELHIQSIQQACKDNELSFTSHIFDASNRERQFSLLNNIAQTLIEQGISKRDCLVVCGGCELMHQAGLLSAMLMRGLRFVQVPTTVAAQLDCPPFQKLTIGLPQHKNLINSDLDFEFSYLDTEFIKLLDLRHINSGLAEAIKLSLAHDAHLLPELKQMSYQQILNEVLKIKSALAKQEGRPSAACLCYGNTIADGLVQQAPNLLLPGEAQALGMLAAAHISMRLGFANPDLLAAHEEIISQFGLPVKVPGAVSVDSIIEHLFCDKKERRSQIGVVLLDRLGSIKLVNGKRLIPVNEKVVRDALESIHELGREEAEYRRRQTA